MNKRTLGSEGLVTSELGFGCMGLNHDRGPAKDRNEMMKVAQHAFDAGVTMFDTAEVYGPYTNEELVGEAIQTFRKEIQLATKGGFNITGNSNYPDSSKETLRNSLEGSLKRLRTDYIDLYYIHRVDPNIPIEEVAQTMQEFKKKGKILHWGLSEASAETIRRAHHIEPLAAVQSEYSIWWRELEKEVIPTLEELKIGLVAYSPLGRGFLTGKLTRDAIASENDNRAELPRFTEEAFKANQVVLDLLQKIANEKDATIAQVSLAWLLAQKDWIVPIPGTTKLSRIDENVGATAIHFSKQELNDINHAVDQLEIVGDRYNQEQKKKTGK
ncbi:aldo/keto reductase [Trichococcus alkaliphilus]|uniref:aldo/keto reductase n=1 Tax=Trichococcus alkaliphilus TaxID=2052943 RepID=UPI000D0BD79A|nr:aldo/keto reductase [Trichococcus alkaliphilus]